MGPFVRHLVLCETSNRTSGGARSNANKQSADDRLAQKAKSAQVVGLCRSRRDTDSESYYGGWVGRSPISTAAGDNERPQCVNLGGGRFFANVSSDDTDKIFTRITHVGVGGGTNVANIVIVQENQTK